MGSRAVVNIGVQQFDKVREQNAFYIDKTGFIKEWWEGGSDITLITRPRRFGKTLNMSMVDCFFSNKYAGRGDLFEGLAIWKEEQYRLLQGTYPVIFLSFANIKADCYKDMVYMITEVVSELYGQNRYLLEGSLLSGNEKEYYESIKPGIESRVARGAIHSGKRSLSYLTSMIPRCRRHGFLGTGMRRRSRSASAMALCLAWW